MSTNMSAETASDLPRPDLREVDDFIEADETEVDEMDLLTERLVELNGQHLDGDDVEDEQKQVFKVLISATYENIYALTVGRLHGDRDMAAEAVQETYLRAWKYREKFRGDSKFSTWLYRIAINTAHSFTTKKVKHTGVSLDEEHMEKHLEDPESNELYEGVEFKLSVPIQELLDKLSDGNRDAIILTVIMDMTDREAGEMMGIEEGAVKLRRWRTLRQLKKLALAENLI